MNSATNNEIIASNNNLELTGWSVLVTPAILLFRHSCSYFLAHDSGSSDISYLSTTTPATLVELAKFKAFQPPPIRPCDGRAVRPLLMYVGYVANRVYHHFRLVQLDEVAA